MHHDLKQITTVTALLLVYYETSIKNTVDTMKTYMMTNEKKSDFRHD